MRGQVVVDVSAAVVDTTHGVDGNWQLLGGTNGFASRAVRCWDVQFE
jgi:hypothetical protein